LFYDPAMLPAWASHLAHLYWRLRAARGMASPSRRTWHRRIRAEKLRLLQAGLPVIEIHLVTRILANPANRFYEARWQRYLAQKVAGVSPWHPAGSGPLKMR
jgi:hypothetical protein